MFTRLNLHLCFSCCPTMCCAVLCRACCVLLSVFLQQVIQLHNAFLSAALQRSLLLQAEVVQHIHNLLAAAKELSKVVESIDTQQTGACARVERGVGLHITSAHSQQSQMHRRTHSLRVCLPD